MSRTFLFSVLVGAFVLVGAGMYLGRGGVAKPVILVLEAIDWARFGPEGEVFPPTLTFPDGEVVHWYSDDYTIPCLRCLHVALNFTGCQTCYFEGGPQTECGKRIDSACHWLYPHRGR